MDVKSVSDVDFDGGTVIVRCDLDVNIDENTSQIKFGNPRLTASINTINQVINNGARRIIIIGHRGRPVGGFEEKLSTHKLIKYFEQNLAQSIYFLGHNDFENFDIEDENARNFQLYLLDNVRFWEGEQSKDDDTRKIFAEKLLNTFSANYYVNEAFASTHRKHASISELPDLIKTKNEAENSLSYGLRFVEEVYNLERIIEDPKRPVVLVLGGLKKDKLNFVESIKEKVDKILIGGRLPEYAVGVKVSVREEKGKVITGELNQDKEDITMFTIERFEDEIAKAGTIVMAGPMGKYEDEGQRLGTKRILEAIKEADAFKVAGGGDSEKALETLGYKDVFDWVSVGGGAMLEYLSKGRLP